jgi:hopanoid biosynthesis associated protein HpnK
MSDRILVVNGDDFGLTSGVNAGILDAHARGILTSASLFANAPSTADAIALARDAPTLGVGCHLTLVDGRPVLPASRVPSLAPDGLFRPTWAGFIAAAVARRVNLREVERELEAQVDSLRSAGLPLTHLDSHKHVHAYPPIFAIVARLARRIGIATVRVPCEAPIVSWLWRTSFTPGARRQAVENIALAPWAAVDRRLLALERLPAAPSFRGRVLTGLLTAESLRPLVETIPFGVTELMTHPGFVDADLDRVRTRLRSARADEVAALTDPEIVAAVRRSGIRLRTHAAARSVLETQQHVP